MKTRSEENFITTVCCVCGTHINGPWPAAKNLSHGYCRFHFLAAMQDVQRFHALLEQAKPITTQALAA